MKRIGLLTSGGDCQALNAKMRGIVKGICNYYDEVEIAPFLEFLKVNCLEMIKYKKVTHLCCMTVS